MDDAGARTGGPRTGCAAAPSLDLACGTGKSFLPFLRRGFDVTGCDSSSAMLAEAARKAPEAKLVHADLRDAARMVGRFDLVNCFDDSLNYLLRRRPTSPRRSRHRGQPRPGGPGDVRPQHAAARTGRRSRATASASATRPSSSGGVVRAERRSGMRARAHESTSSLRALTASTSASTRATRSGISLASASSSSLGGRGLECVARARRARSDCSLVEPARRVRAPEGPLHRATREEEVMPSDHQEDRQAGPAGSVHHEDLG